MNTSLKTCFKCGCEKPLFIPLKRQFFDAFKNGTKRRGPSGHMEEYRPNGPRWNERTCTIGRRVILSLGYGKNHRLTGTVANFRVQRCAAGNIPGWLECYGPSIEVPAACIGIQLDSPQ